MAANNYRDYLDGQSASHNSTPVTYSSSNWSYTKHRQEEMLAKENRKLKKEIAQKDGQLEAAMNEIEYWKELASENRADFLNSEMILKSTKTLLTSFEKGFQQQVSVIETLKSALAKYSS